MSATAAFLEDIATAESDEFRNNTRDELLTHISLQRTLIRNLYLRIMELEEAVAQSGINLSKGGMDSPGVTSKPQSISIEKMAESRLGGRGIFLSPSEAKSLGSQLTQHEAQQAQTAFNQRSNDVRHPMSHDGVTTHPNQTYSGSTVSSPRGPPSPTPFPSKGAAAGVSALNQGAVDSIIGRIQRELFVVQRTLDTAHADGLPYNTIEQLKHAELELIDAIASMQPVQLIPPLEELEAYKAAAFARGMSTWTNPLKEKASAEDVALAQAGRFRPETPSVGALSGRRSPIPSSSPLPLQSIERELRQQRYDSHAPTAEPVQPQHRRGLTPYESDPVRVQSLDAQRRATYREPNSPAKEKATATGATGPPLPLLRKLQYRLQSRLNAVDNADGAAEPNRGQTALADDVSSIHITTDPATGQIVIGRRTTGKDSVTPQRHRNGGAPASPSAKANTPRRASPAADRISAYRRGRAAPGS
jgi:hypothetical protein